MSGKFFWDLALKNIRRNRQSYLPYALSCAGTVTMFFIMFVLSNTSTLRGVFGGRSLQMTLGFGVWVMVLFAVLFMFYTHGFLIKRRKKEFGLFNILGMEKRHIGRVLALETALVALLSTGAGMLLGAMLIKLMYLVILRTLSIAEIGALVIPESAYPLTLSAFLIIHLLTLFNTLREIHLTDPVNLLRGGSLGEREPKARRWLALLGAVCLAGGYATSFTVKDAITAIPLYFLAVVLVIIGTYALFTSGSIAILRALRRNKRFYYHPRHFSVIAGMIHRMRRNAAGLATICILSTMVLVMVSSTVTIFAASEKKLGASMMGRDARMVMGPVDEDMADLCKTIVFGEAAKAGIPVENPVIYRNMPIYAVLDSTKSPLRMDAGAKAGEALTSIHLVPVEDYNALQKDSIALAQGEALSHSLYGQPLPGEVVLGGLPLRVRENLAQIAPLDNYPQMMQDTYILVMNREDIARVAEAFMDVPGVKLPWELVLAFDTGSSISAEKVETFFKSVRQRTRDVPREGGFYIDSNHRVPMQAEYRAFFGGLLFVAIFLGLTFIMAMVLIIYYKQVSEGLEDQARFAIMQKVGMSDAEVRQSVKSQVLMVFFIPLVMAGIHVLAAYNITIKVLTLTGLLTGHAWLLWLIILITYVCFALFYALVYIKTSSSYYKIVKA